jgi:hypothetical protein
MATIGQMRVHGSVRTAVAIAGTNLNIWMSVDVVLESRYFEPFAKNVAAMACFEVAVGSRYITFSEDRTKSTASGQLCLVKDSKTFKRLTPLMKSEGRSVAYCHLPVGKSC